MKFKLAAGAELDLLTRDELREELSSAGAWRKEIARAAKFPTFSATTNVAGGVWSVGPGTADNQAQKLGPEPGFVWSIMRVVVNGNGIVYGTDLWNLFIGDPSPSKFVLRANDFQQFNVGALIISGGDQLYASGVGTGVAGTDVALTGQAIELPVQLAWRLM